MINKKIRIRSNFWINEYFGKDSFIKIINYSQYWYFVVCKILKGEQVFDSFPFFYEFYYEFYIYQLLVRLYNQIGFVILNVIILDNNYYFILNKSEKIIRYLKLSGFRNPDNFNLVTMGYLINLYWEYLRILLKIYTR